MDAVRNLGDGDGPGGPAVHSILQHEKLGRDALPGQYLVVWLPLVSMVTLALLCGIAVRSGWRWTAVAAIGVILGAVQFTLIVLTNSSRLGNSFLPAVLLALSVAALL